MTPKALLAHHNALITLVRHLLDDRTGGVFSATVEMLTKVIGAKGALAYRLESSELVLVSETGLPRKAKAWLARMPVDDRPWFVAQRVAATQKAEVDSQLADSRMGHSIRPALEAAGWRALAGAPIRIGRKVFGVIVVASATGFDRQTLLLLETICGLLALSSEREQTIQRSREDKQREAKTAQLATMGLLASTVARDLATPLASIQLQLEAQETKLRDLHQRLVTALGDEDAPELDTLEEAEVLSGEIGAGIRHTQGITSRLLSFSRETRPEMIDLSRVVQSAIQLLREGIEARGIMLEVEGDDTQLAVDGREEALQMLVVQLVLHCADEIDAAKVRGARILVQLQKEQESCLLSVASSGRTGQRVQSDAPGLELARQTAIAHGGQVEIHASDLGGPLIRIVLPEAASLRVAAEPEPAAPTPRRLASGQRRIIVWIDEDSSRAKTISRSITTHETLIANSIAEAAELLESLDLLPELIVCDVALSDGFGVDLHCEVEEQLAERFVFVTGGVVGEDVAAYLKASGRPTLIKPVSVEEVRALLPAVSQPVTTSGPPLTEADLEDAGRPLSPPPPHTPIPGMARPRPPGGEGTHPGHRVNLGVPGAASIFGPGRGLTPPPGGGTEPIHMRRARRTHKRRDAATVQEVPKTPEELAAEQAEQTEQGEAPDPVDDDPVYTEEIADEDSLPEGDLSLRIDDLRLDDEDAEW